MRDLWKAPAAADCGTSPVQDVNAMQKAMSLAQRGREDPIPQNFVQVRLLHLLAELHLHVPHNITSCMLAPSIDDMHIAVHNAAQHHS